MDDESRGNWLALREDDGRAYLLRRAPGEVKIKGLGRFDAEELLEGYSLGDRIKVGQKSLTIVNPSLPEARRNMARRARSYRRQGFWFPNLMDGNWNRIKGSREEGMVQEDWPCILRMSWDQRDPDISRGAD